MKTEAVTQAQLDALIRIAGPLGALVGGLDEVDLTKGRGVLEDSTRCLWTKDRKRVTVSPLTGGGMIVSCANDPDPECPE